MGNWLEMSFENNVLLWEFFFSFINHDRMPSWGYF